MVSRPPGASLDLGVWELQVKAGKAGPAGLRVDDEVETPADPGVWMEIFGFLTGWNS